MPERDAADSARLGEAIRALAPALEGFYRFEGSDPAARERASWRAALQGPLPEAGQGLDAVLRTLRDVVIPHGLRNGAPGFAGWVTTSPTTAGVAAVLPGHRVVPPAAAAAPRAHPRHLRPRVHVPVTERIPRLDPVRADRPHPIEFQGACFRIGHTMIRPSYRANLKGDGGKPFFGLIFDPALGDITPAPGKDPADLRSGFRAPRRFIGWQTFFDFKGGDVKTNKLMDTKISTPLFTLPLGAIASHKAPTALMQRNLLRHVTWSMPSGQSIAAAMGVDRLSADDLKELKGYGVGLEQHTPLFYYMLRESALVPNSDIGKNTGGFHMGPVGGRIVGEVTLGLLQTDPGSHLVQRPDWTPTLQNPGPAFRMTDFLTFAGVDPATRRTQKPSFA